jgi:hypothetical protein
VLRNLVEYPRAWVVHEARAAVRSTEITPGRRSKTLQELLYAPDPVWHNASQPAYDPHNVAWLRSDDLSAIHHYLSGRKPGPSEAVRVNCPSPEQAVLEVTLDSPGLVVLADVDYPGWALAIDARPAPFYRVNGLMRGAAVSAGPHRLVYTYAPRSFRIGRLVSIAGLAALLALCLHAARRPSVRVVAGREESISDET